MIGKLPDKTNAKLLNLIFETLPNKSLENFPTEARKAYRQKLEELPD